MARAKRAYQGGAAAFLVGLFGIGGQRRSGDAGGRRRPAGAAAAAGVRRPAVPSSSRWPMPAGLMPATWLRLGAGLDQGAEREAPAARARPVRRPRPRRARRPEPSSDTSRRPMSSTLSDHRRQTGHRAAAAVLAARNGWDVAINYPRTPGRRARRGGGREDGRRALVLQADVAARPRCWRCSTPSTGPSAARGVINNAGVVDALRASTR